MKNRDNFPCLVGIAVFPRLRSGVFAMPFISWPVSLALDMPCLVGIAGLEPATSAPPVRRPAKLGHIPIAGAGDYRPPFIPCVRI